MTRLLSFVLLVAVTALGTLASSPAVSSDTPNVTFNKNVLPILQTNCQVCHRPGGVAPMPLLTYENARPWAKAIKTAVITKQMPPWFADPHYGGFRNAPKLTESDIQTLAAWADTGAKEGDAADKPAGLEWNDGWRIQPDVVVSMQKPYRIAAKGVGEIKQFIIETPFKEDTWVSSIEIRPGDGSVVHHAILKTLPAGSADFKIAVAQTAIFKSDGRPGEQNLGSYSDVMAKLRERQTGRGAFMTMEAVYAPGSPPLDFRFTDSAKLIRGGQPLSLEVHYTSNGHETMDQTSVGFMLAKAPADREFVIMAPEHLVDPRKPIPAGTANWETTGELTFNRDVDLVWFMPHMHLRGKDMTFRLIYPNGREETVLSAKFNFHWQLGYEVDDPIKIKKGTRMIVTAHHDNSANNALNPTPDKDVKWGEMTSDEMMLPWFGVVVPIGAQPDMIATYKPGDFDGPVPSAPALQERSPVVAPAVLRTLPIFRPEK